LLQKGAIRPKESRWGRKAEAGIRELKNGTDVNNKYQERKRRLFQGRGQKKVS